jgi:hypothetical protein
VRGRVHSSAVSVVRGLAVVLIILAGHVGAATAQPAGAPALVGSWMGGWKSSTTGSSGTLDITIDSVDGNQVSGSLFMAVAAPDTQGYYNRSVPFRGFFDGTVLRINVPPALWFEMTVAGQVMRGGVQGQQTFGTAELHRK